MNVLRIALVLFWCLAGAAIIGVLPAPVDRMVLFSAIVVAAVHVLEFAGFFLWARKKTSVSGHDAAMTFVFGVLYLKPRMEALKRSE